MSTCHPVITSLSVAFDYFSIAMPDYLQEKPGFTYLFNNDNQGKSFDVLAGNYCKKHKQPHDTQSIIYKWALGVHDMLLSTPEPATEMIDDIILQKNKTPIMDNLTEIFNEHSVFLNKTQTYYKEKAATNEEYSILSALTGQKIKAIGSLCPITVSPDRDYSHLYNSAEKVDALRKPPRGAILLPRIEPKP